MAKRVPFEPEHAARIRLQPRQIGAAGYATPTHYAKLAATASFSVLDGDEVVMCGGAFEIWPGRRLCWALLAESIGHRMVSCVRITRRFLAEVAAPRYELDVEVDHAEGHRFAQALGFTVETPRLRAFYPDGTDGTMYVRVTQ